MGVSGDGGLPLRVGLRDGNRSDSAETPLAIEECLALGLEGVRGIVADSKPYSRRTLGLCLEQEIGLVTLVPRTCAIRQGDVEAMSCQAEERGHGEANTMHQQAGTGRCAAGEYAGWYTGDHGPGGRGESTGFHAPQHDRGKDQSEPVPG